MDCDILLVVGTPAVRLELIARLARAYYHADPQLIDETSVRSEDGVWRYRDPRMQRVYNAVVRAELTQCSHRNRPLRYDRRVVVTLCADEVLYLPITTEITSLPQLTPEGLPLALARRAAEQQQMVRTGGSVRLRYLGGSEAPSGNLLAFIASSLAISSSAG